MVSHSTDASCVGAANFLSADTHLSSRYFAEVARHHTNSPETNQETMYVPPIVFDRNLHEVPLPVRTADLMWAGAGLSSLYTGSRVCIPTSVYSLPMALVERVGGWDTGPGAIGEDLHMYLKCFFALSGNLKVHAVYAAASQCNVSSTVRGFRGYVDGLNARYKQALRHMWGVMDTGYAVRETLRMIGRHYEAGRPLIARPSSMKDVAVASRRTVLNGMSVMCAFNWTASDAKAGIHKSLVSQAMDSNRAPLPAIHIQNVWTVFHRLFEAHFLPNHLVMILMISTIYEHKWGSLVPRELATALYFCLLCRWIGWTLIVIFFYRYDTYHRLCVDLRREEMRVAGLDKKVAEHGGFRSSVFVRFSLFEAGIFPLGGTIFGALPTFHATLCQIFTDTLTYQVSLKPKFTTHTQEWRDIRP